MSLIKNLMETPDPRHRAYYRLRLCAVGVGVPLVVAIAALALLDLDLVTGHNTIRLIHAIIGGSMVAALIILLCAQFDVTR